MVSSAFHPLNIFIVGLGGAFLIPLVNRFGRRWLSAVVCARACCHDADLGRLPVAACAGRGADRNPDRRRESALCDQFADGSSRGDLRFQRQSRRPARRPRFCPRNIRRDAALPSVGHGHPGHGDDPRLCSICSCSWRSSRSPPMACSACRIRLPRFRPRSNT